MGFGPESGVHGGDCWVSEWTLKMVKVGELRALEGAALAVGFDIQGSWWIRV